MRVNQVIIIPAFAKNSRGQAHLRSDQYDLMNAYVDALCEHLDHENIQHWVHRDGELIYPNSLILHCGIGWDKPDKKSAAKHNWSTVAFCEAHSRKLADMLSEMSSEWGKIFVDHSHKCRTVTNDKRETLRYINTIGLYIEPFIMNGIKAEDYFQMMGRYGEVLAQTIYDFMSERGEVKKIHGMGYK